MEGPASSSAVASALVCAGGIRLGALAVLRVRRGAGLGAEIGIAISGPSVQGMPPLGSSDLFFFGHLPSSLCRVTFHCRLNFILQSIHLGEHFFKCFVRSSLRVKSLGPSRGDRSHRQVNSRPWVYIDGHEQSSVVQGILA